MTTQPTRRNDRHNDFEPIRHTFIVRPGMNVHVTTQAIREFNRSSQNCEDGLILKAGHLYRIAQMVSSYCELIEVSTGRNFGWFVLDKLILVVSYKGFTIYGKRRTQWKDYRTADHTPWTAEIYYPGGKFCEAVYLEAGFWATMRAATRKIDTIIAKEIEDEFTARMIEMSELHEEGRFQDWRNE